KNKEMQSKASKEKAPMFKVYNVFNLEQTTLEAQAVEEPIFEEKKIHELINALCVSVYHFGNSAHYSQKDDVIVLPHKNQFHSKENYYATLLHELTHWTSGKEERCPRESFKNYHTD